MIERTFVYFERDFTYTFEKMSLESINAEWDELSKEYSKLEVREFVRLRDAKKVYFYFVECFFSPSFSPSRM